MKFRKNRPWLRYLEGVDGGQAGGANDQSSGQSSSTDAGSSDAGKATGGDQDDAAARLIAAVEAQVKGSEPASAKPKEQADSDEMTMAQVMEMLEDQQKTIATLQQASATDAAEKRAALALDVAKEAKLPESMATRLTGDTREQLESDATELAKSLGSFVRDPAQGQGGGKTPQMDLGQSVAARLAAAGIK